MNDKTKGMMAALIRKERHILVIFFILAVLVIESLLLAAPS
jgi:hypothetical protein